MPAPIITGLVTYLEEQLDITVWEGEVPRQDTDGVDISIDGGEVVFRVVMASDQGLQREWTTEDPYEDMGTIVVELWAITRATVEESLSDIEALLVNSTNWPDIPLGTGFEVNKLLLSSWYSGQEEGVRTKGSNLIYKGILRFDVGIHGAISTR